MPATACSLLQHSRGLDENSPFTNGLLFTANLIQSNKQSLAATKQPIHYLNTKQAGQ